MDQAVTVRKLLAETFLLSKMQTLTAAACRAGERGMPNVGLPHGRRKDFSRGALREFFQNFSRGDKSGKICFSRSKRENTLLLLKLSKSRKEPSPPALPFRRPWLATKFGHENITKNGA